MMLGQFSLLPLVTAVVVALSLLGLGAALQHAADRVPGSGSQPPWDANLAEVDRAISRGDLRSAASAWREAYARARASQRWDGMLAVGDAYLRIGTAAGDVQASVPKARETYLIALFRARRAGAVDGMVRSAGAFEAMGDHDLAARAVRMAEGLAETRRDLTGRERAREIAEVIASPVVAEGLVQ